MVEDMSADRNLPLSYFEDQGVNGLKTLSAQGNFDYTPSATTSTYNEHLYGNALYNFTNPVANPFGGESQISRHRFDANQDGLIFWNPTQGNDRTPSNEQQYSVVVNGAFEDGFVGPGIAFNAYPGFGSAANKLSISSPTPIFEHQHYDPNTAKLSPITLSGLSVELLSQDRQTGAITIQVRYDDVNITTDTRWTGNLVMMDVNGPLPPRPGTTASDVIVTGATLTINKSGTPNRHLPTVAGDFINPTRLTCPAGTLLELSASPLDIGAGISIEDSKTTVQVAGEMTLGRSCNVLVKAGALLELMAGSSVRLRHYFSSIRVEAGGTLLIHSGATVQGAGNITVEDGGYVCVESGATLSCAKNVAPNAIISTNPSLGLPAQNCQSSFLLAPTTPDTQRSTLYTATPNPANDQVTLALLLHEGGPVQVSLQDLSGVPRLTLEPRTLEAGTHKLEVPLHSVPTGVYLLVVESPEGRQVTRLQVNH